MDLPIKTSSAEGTARVSAGGEVDLSTIGQLRTAVLGAAEDSQRVVLDLSGVGFIDTTGLAALVELRSTLQGRGVLFEIEAADGPVRQAVDVTGLHHLLTG